MTAAITSTTTAGMALRNSLRNGFCSARPLIHGVVRGWWGARIRPRPPYVRKAGGLAGSDPVPPRRGGEGSADGSGLGTTGRRTEIWKEKKKEEEQRSKAGRA